MEKFDNKNVDELAQIVDERICVQTLETLRELGNMVGLQKKDVEAANRRNLKRWIRNIVEEKVDDGDAEDEAKKKYLLDMLKSLENLTINDVSGSNADESESAATNNTNKMDTREKYVMPALEDTDDGESNVSLLRELGILKKTSLLRKEFKIKSQIGEVVQGDKISYVSFMHQINEPKSSGYDEEDIINSVIRAMTPNLTLRNVLETTPHLSLKKLVQYLEAHFDKRSATNFCSKFTSMTQLHTHL